MAKNSGRSFNFPERTSDDLKERANMRGGGFDSFIQSKYKRYKVREGKNVIRVLPPTWDNARHYGFDIFVNYGIGPDNAQYLSLSKHNKGRDPISEAQRKASRDGDDDLAKQLAPRQRILMWVIDRQDESEGPQLWDCPFTVDKKFCNLARDEDSNEVIFIDDIDKGCDVRFYKEGKGLNTDYDSKPMKLMNRGPLSDDEEKIAEWVEFIQQNPVPDCLQFYDADYIDQVFSGQPPSKTKSRDEDETKTQRTLKAEDDEADAPAPKRVRPKSNEDDDEAPTKAESIRERLTRRRQAAEVKADDDDTEDDDE